MLSTTCHCGSVRIHVRRAPRTDKLQLLHLAPIRRALGILPGHLGSNRSTERWPVQLLLAPQDSRILSMQYLWLRDAL